MLAGEEAGTHGHHQRRGPPGDRVNLIERAEPVGVQQRELVADVDHRGRHREVHRRPAGQPGHRYREAAYDGHRDPYHGEGHDLVIEMLGDGVPDRVQRTPGDHGRDDQRGQMRLRCHAARTRVVAHRLGAWKICPRTDGSLCLSRMSGHADKSPRGFYPVRCGGRAGPWRRSVQAAAVLIVSRLTEAARNPRRNHKLVPRYQRKIPVITCCAPCLSPAASGNVRDHQGGEIVMTNPEPVHAESEAHAWGINVPNHPTRADSPEYVAARSKMNEIAGQAAGMIYGQGPFEDHHGGALWLKDSQGWFLVRNQAGIEWSAQFCAEPAKVDLLRQNAQRLYNLLSPKIKQQLDPDGLLDTPIRDAAGVAKWTDSIFNAGVPLHPTFHTGVLPTGMAQNPAVPASAQPASAQPASAQPASAQPASAQPAGVHHYPTPIADIQLFKYDDFQL